MLPWVWQNEEAQQAIAAALASIAAKTETTAETVAIQEQMKPFLDETGNIDLGKVLVTTLLPKLMKTELHIMLFWKIMPLLLLFRK